MVLRGGENIYCAEVEAAIYEHPAVAECTAFSVPDDRLGEEVGVAIYKNDNILASAEEIRESCRSKIAGHKIPRYIWFLDDPIPRNANGKFLKRELKDSLDTSAAN